MTFSILLHGILAVKIIMLTCYSFSFGKQDTVKTTITMVGVIRCNEVCQQQVQETGKTSKTQQMMEILYKMILDDILFNLVNTNRFIIYGLLIIL